MMNIEAKQQYMETLRERYLKGSKKRKGEILDEYCRNTGQERKYVGKKFRYKVKLKEVRKNRREYYDGETKSVLAEIWKILPLPRTPLGNLISRLDFLFIQKLQKILNRASNPSRKRPALPPTHKKKSLAGF